MRLALLTALTLTAFPAAAEDAWQSLPAPIDNGAIITTDPLRGFFGFEGGSVAPVARPMTEHYFRVAWAAIEPSQDVYDFAAIDRVLATLGPGERIAFGVMPLDTCCSRPDGLDIPAYLKDRLTKGFWIDADAGSAARHAYVPDWNDPYYLERWRALWTAIGKHYDGDPRVAWVDLRGYGNWGEGHLAGAGAYHWSQIPYDDPKVNTAGARPGTQESRFAIVDAIAAALPHTRLIAMTDDKEVLLHALRLSPAIGMKRDSWGARWFESLVPENMNADDRALILDRWKTAPFLVESYGWKLVFEAGYDGIVKQIADYHVSAIGNGNFNVGKWSDLDSDQQTALVRSADISGYRYVPSAVRYRTTAACPLEVDIDWQNHGVAPAYEPWSVRLWLKPAHGPEMPGSTTQDLPAILPGETQTSDTCFGPAAGRGGELLVQVASPDGRRTLVLPLDRTDGNNRYGLGAIDLK